MRPLILVIVALFSGCSAEPVKDPPVFHHAATVRQLMHDMVLPAAETVWDSVGTIMTIEKTEEIRPRTEDEWWMVRSGALVLTESANLLIMDGRAPEAEGWTEHAQALGSAAETALKAARAEDPEALFDAGGDIYNACQSCHAKYRQEYDPENMR